MAVVRPVAGKDDARLIRMMRLRAMAIRARGAKEPAGKPPVEMASQASQAIGPGAAEPASMGLGEMASQAWQNIGPSAGQYLDDMTQIVTDPIGTAKGVGQVAVGGLQKLGDLVNLPSVSPFGDQRASAEAVGEFFADRYGGWENIKQTLATDPVGAAGDLAGVLSGGGLAAGRLPGLAGQFGKIAGKVGNAVDPASAAARGIGLLGKKVAAPVATGVLGMTTGTGPTAIRTATAAGMAGGDLGTKFRAAMRGQVPMEEVVNSAKGAVDNLYRQRSQAYQSGMKDVAGDPTVLDFKKVDDALASVTEVKNFKGVPISRSTADIRGKIKELIDQWRGLDPTEYHTVEGFDALKQSLGDVLESAQYGTAEWKVANEAYQAVKRTITDQAPGYAKIMKDYTQATELLQEIQRELSLGKKGNPATAPPQAPGDHPG